jgi:hypothetical protein
MKIPRRLKRLRRRIALPRHRSPWVIDDIEDRPEAVGPGQDGDTQRG